MAQVPRVSHAAQPGFGLALVFRGRVDLGGGGLLLDAGEFQNLKKGTVSENKGIGQRRRRSIT